MAATTLTINGTAYTQSGRRTANYLIDGWGWDLDSGYWLEFHEHTSGPQPVIAGPLPVELSISSTTLFAGDIVSVQPAIDGGGARTWGYRCLGLEYRAAWIPVTAQDGSGIIRFNVSPTNITYYAQSMAGQTVGQILTYCLTQHATALTAAGITTDATTTSELAALTLVPNSEVQIAGERLWQAMQGFCQQYARNIRPVITGAGLVRFVDITAGAAHTLTLGTDPVDPPLFSRNWTSSATRVTVRGQGVIEPGYVSVLRNSLTPAWTSGEQTSWAYTDFTNPNGASVDAGGVTSVTSATTVTIQSSNAARTWATNFWNGIQAWIYLTNPSGSGLTYQESRPVTACGAMTAGGTCSVTLGYALQNSASGAYTKYQLIGTDVPLASGGLYDVWRLYNVTDPGGQIANHMVTTFPAQVAFVGWNGESATLTNAPTCQIVGPNGAGPAQFYVLPNSGQVLFVRPVVEVINSTSALSSGSYTTPTDVYVLLAYSRGALTTTYPASGYSGTAYTAAGLARTQTHDAYDWSYYGNSPVLNDLAQMLQVSVRNTLTEGTISYKGLYTAPQDPTGGHVMNIAASSYTTGDESLNVPVRGYTVRYLTSGSGGLNYHTEIRCNNRQDPRTGEGQYSHLSVLGSRLELGGGGTIGGAAPGFDGVAGWGFGGGPEDSGITYGDDGRRAGAARKKTRLGDSEGRYHAAEAHDARDRERSAEPDWGTRIDQQAQAMDDRENNERVVQSDNARRSRTTSPDWGPRVDQQAIDAENTERVVRSDNARRARTNETPTDRSYRVAASEPAPTPPPAERVAKGNDALDYEAPPAPAAERIAKGNDALDYEAPPAPAAERVAKGNDALDYEAG